METTEAAKALKMALQALSAPANQLIHHTCSGVQYCSRMDANRLRVYQIQISKTEYGDPPENAIAGRDNGIIKEEYFNYCTITSAK